MLKSEYDDGIGISIDKYCEYLISRVKAGVTELSTTLNNYFKVQF